MTCDARQADVGGLVRALRDARDIHWAFYFEVQVQKGGVFF
jgi:hypothetical protein